MVEEPNPLSAITQPEPLEMLIKKAGAPGLDRHALRRLLPRRNQLEPQTPKRQEVCHVDAPDRI